MCFQSSTDLKENTVTEEDQDVHQEEFVGSDAESCGLSDVCEEGEEEGVRPDPIGRFHAGRLNTLMLQQADEWHDKEREDTK